jgi:divalent metal cation (Fe/Co/Zn/Cd) transporter
MPNIGAKHVASIRRGVVLEVWTLSWNVVDVVILAFAAYVARSVALAGFGLDSLIEIGAGVVVLWELRDIGGGRRARARGLIGWAFIVLALYVAVQSSAVLAVGFHPHHSPIGIGWTALTAVVMFILANAKRRVGHQLANQVLITEGRVTFVDGVLASAVLVGLVLNAVLGWWWADPTAGLLIVVYGAKEGVAALRHGSLE